MNRFGLFTIMITIIDKWDLLNQEQIPQFKMFQLSKHTVILESI